MGGWGLVHTEVYSTHHLASLTAVCDLNEGRAQEAAGCYRASKIYTGYTAMVRNPEIAEMNSE